MPYLVGKSSINFTDSSEISKPNGEGARILGGGKNFRKNLFNESLDILNIIPCSEIFNKNSTTGLYLILL